MDGKASVIIFRVCVREYFVMKLAKRAATSSMHDRRDNFISANLRLELAGNLQIRVIISDDCRKPSSSRKLLAAREQIRLADTLWRSVRVSDSHVVSASNACQL